MAAETRNEGEQGDRPGVEAAADPHGCRWHMTPGHKPDGAGSYSAESNHVASSRRLGKDGSPWSLGKAFSSTESQKEKGFPFAVPSVLLVLFRRVSGGAG